MSNSITANNMLEVRFKLSTQDRDNQTVSRTYLDINTTIPASGVTAIFGHSGSGKTSLLRCIAGLEKAEQGKVSIHKNSWQETWQDTDHFSPVHKRSIGYVFQEASLFPHLTAQKNLTYAIKRADQAVSAEFYQRVIDVMGIEGILTRYPSQISGGERQRIAIARALLIQPRLLLMDEPLAALDYQRKQEILPYLERLHQSFDIPIIYVSHSMDEVARLADHILVLDQGKVIAEGALTEVFSRIDLPQRLEDESGVILNGKVVEKDNEWQLMRIAFADSHIWIPDSADFLIEESLEQAVRIRILAKDVSLSLTNHEDTSIVNRILVRVVDIKSDKDRAMSLVRLRMGSDFLVAKMTQKSVYHLGLEEGMEVWAQVKSVALVR
jgi:molybdate transport system ATP-binding protein